MKIAFIITCKRNNVVVSFGTLKVQSFMLTEVRDCDLLIVVTSSTFLKRKEKLKEKRQLDQIIKTCRQHMYRQMYCVHLYGLYVYCALVDLDSCLPFSRRHLRNVWKETCRGFGCVTLVNFLRRLSHLRFCRKNWKRYVLCDKNLQ